MKDFNKSDADELEGCMDAVFILIVGGIIGALWGIGTIVYHVFTWLVGVT